MSAATAPRLDVLTDPTGTTEGEKKGREGEVRRILGRAVYAALPDREREQPHAEGDVQEWVDRVLRAMNGKGWRVHKSNPVCSRCAGELEVEGQAWREYLASPELQEQLEREKAERVIDAAEHSARMEANK